MRVGHSVAALDAFDDLVQLRGQRGRPPYACKVMPPDYKKAGTDETPSWYA